MSNPLAGRSVLVTGGTGSFGRHFVRRALESSAARVVVFSRDELKQSEMRAQFGDEPRLRFFLGDVRDPVRLDLALHNIDDVIHAAAMKRIDACEEDPSEAIATNIIGTQNVALSAINAGVERALFLSTDKAPAAHTLYGMTKAVAERLWVQSNVYAAGTGTMLSATRYGNVVGSRGSVVGLWREQIARGEPLTITDERATRFWMTLNDAVDLVYLALNDMRGGDIFVPKAPSSSILDLARAVAESGVMSCSVVGGPVTWSMAPYEPGHIETGLRPGERLHETLISQDEARTVYDRGTHYVIEPAAPTWHERSPLFDFQRVGSDFDYRSDTNPETATVDDLRRMVA